MQMVLLVLGWIWHLSDIVTHWWILLYWILPEFYYVPEKINCVCDALCWDFSYLDCTTYIVLRIWSHIISLYPMWVPVFLLPQIIVYYYLSAWGESGLLLKCHL